MKSSSRPASALIDVKSPFRLESSLGRELPLDRPSSAQPGETIQVRYDLPRLRATLTRDAIASGPASLWRYAALLPIAAPEHIVSLGEGYTPLLEAPVLARGLGLRELWIKDEGLNPTGTFKDRGASVALSRYRELGVATVALNSSGNAGGAWSLYAARAGLTCMNLLPTDVPPASAWQCRVSGQPTFVTERWHEAGRMVAEASAQNGWLNVSTLKEPYRLEGKKTMGLEIAEQLGWTLPDAIVYPVGGGLGAVAIYKAFEELLELGWVEGKLPKLIVSQYAGCAPLVQAFEAGQAQCTLWGKIDIPPGGLKNPNPPAGPLVLDLMRRHGGGAIAVSTEDAYAAVDELAASTGVFGCPESATTLVALKGAIRKGWVGAGDRVVLLNTGSGLKSVGNTPGRGFPLVTDSTELRV
jgi:threonine synthase